MRELKLKERQELMSHVRELLFDKTLCPFHVEFEFIRIISGEEEVNIFDDACGRFRNPPDRSPSHYMSLFPTLASTLCTPLLVYLQSTLTF